MGEPGFLSKPQISPYKLVKPAVHWRKSLIIFISLAMNINFSI